MQILAASLNKGFSFIEVIVTLLIISLVGSSFYIFFQNTNIPVSLNTEIKNFQDFANYTGNQINIYEDRYVIVYQSNYEVVNKVDYPSINAVIDINNKYIKIEDNEPNISIYPGWESNIKKIILSNGEVIEL
tara:strand:- start:324 stop:719 length:396 start_codon:yes stop_codon:yes gene_type:complete